MEFIWYGLGVVLVFVAAVRIAGLRMVMRLRLRGMTASEAAAEAIPEGLRAAVEDAAVDWAAHGFFPEGWTVETWTDAHDDRPVHVLWCRHRDGHWLRLAPSHLPEPGRPVFAELLTPTGGVLLSTTLWQPDALAIDVPGMRRSGVVADDPAMAVAGHLAAVGTIDGQPTLADMAARFATTHDRLLEALVAAGQAERRRDGVGFRLAAAWGLLRRAMAESRRTQAALRQARRERRTAAGRPVLIPAIESDAMERHTAAQERRGQGGFSWALLVGTLTMFAVVGLVQFDRPMTLVLIVAALLLHEAGHWLAMVLVGYRDTAMFFVPLIGAMVTGRKDDVTVPQRFVVLLAGPLPGLLLGLPLLLVPGLAHDFGIMLIALNAINLLPLHPLDGGQIVHLLFFRRMPYLDVAMQTTALVGLAAIGVWLAPPLLFVAGFLLIGLGGRVQAARLHRRALREGPPATIPAVAAMACAEPGHDTQPFTLRLHAVRTVVERLRQPACGGGVVAALFIAYLVALLLAPLAIFGWMLARALMGIEPV